MSRTRDKDLNIKPKYGFFYIITNHMGRVKIGITQNPKQRLGSYIKHNGCDMEFNYLYFGDYIFIKKLENLIKVKEEFLVFTKRKSEWLSDEYSVDQVLSIVEKLRWERVLHEDVVLVDYTKLNYDDLAEDMIKESLKSLVIS
jgi:hypothetical protein